ncbi:metal ABC transporter solute-binding protein, Zn/Mn family [Streptococcus sp. Marseille-P6264]|uniref:metal ABC transporter solute-binding protein, Zn/Mn family n=1 Tax=Streptococcus sp. Marseille-P6264 TaxID=2487315 RepID=UPI0011E6659A|nr:zinc ABC transporter substrate-binding protein [Streptococcus sp. Marseille-P6264]
MKIKKVLIALSLVLLGLGLASCSKKEASGTGSKRGLNIVTSFYPIYSMVKEVSGDLNDVRMIQSGAGIHEFEPSASDVAAIYEADVFVYHSRTLESWAGSLDPSLQKSKVAVVEASNGMQLDKVAGLEEVSAEEGIDEKTLYDPHTWLDPEKVAEEAQLIAQALSKLDSKNADTYQKNAQKFAEKAKVLSQKYQGVFSRLDEKTFVTQHTAFSYLAKRFGLKQLGISGIAPDQEPSPRQLTEIQDFIKTYKVKTIFVESNASSKLAETLKKATGVNLKVLNPLEADPENDKTYLENLEDNLEILAKELKH